MYSGAFIDNVENLHRVAWIQQLCALWVVHGKPRRFSSRNSCQRASWSIRILRRWRTPTLAGGPTGERRGELAQPSVYGGILITFRLILIIGNVGVISAFSLVGVVG